MVRPEHIEKDRWRVRVFIGYDHRGKPIQRTRVFRAATRKEAKALGAQHEAELRREDHERKDRRKTLNGLIDEWQAFRDPKDSTSTVRKRAGMIARIRDGIGHVPLVDLSARHVDRWMSDMAAAGLSSTTIANHWSCLRAILNQGDDWDMVTPRAAKKAKPPRRVSNRRPVPPTAAATRLLIDSAGGDLRIAAMLGAYAGLRRGEVIALRWSDVDGHTLHVRHAIVDAGGGRWREKLPKSDEPRSFTIDADLAAALADHRAGLEQRAGELGATLRPDGFVLPRLAAAANRWPVDCDPAGSIPRPVGWLTLAWKRHAEKMGAPNVRFHDLRHYFATEQLDGNVPIKTVQNRLGHRQTKTTTDIYGHGTDAADAAAAEVLRLRRALPGPAAKPLVDDSI